MVTPRNYFNTFLIFFMKNIIIGMYSLFLYFQQLVIENKNRMN